MKKSYVISYKNGNKEMNIKADLVVEKDFSWWIYGGAGAVYSPSGAFRIDKITSEVADITEVK